MRDSFLFVSRLKQGASHIFGNENCNNRLQEEREVVYEYQSREEEKRVMEETGMIFDQLMEWEDKASAPSLTEIENKVIELKNRVEEKMMKAVIEKEEKRQKYKKQICPICGGELGNKGSKEKIIETQIGSIKLKRKYCYCPNCRKGFFPPG